MKTLEDERYVVIKTYYKCTVSEIFVLAYIACLSYPYNTYRVYRLYDT